MQPHVVYYLVKPLIPGRLRLGARRKYVDWKCRRVASRWPIDPRTASEPPNWNGWPKGKRFAVVLTHDVEGHDQEDRCRRLLDIEQSRGFCASYNFVPRKSSLSPSLHSKLIEAGFEVGVHGLSHDGLLYASKGIFTRRARKINRYLKEWGAVGFRSPAMHHNLDWLHHIEMEYDASTFDTDPFEPQADGTGTMFPFWVRNHNNHGGFVELPYTLPQDFTLFVLMQAKNIEVWKKKIEWIARHGGMVLLITHPDYLYFGEQKIRQTEYPAERYVELLDHLKTTYKDQYWHALPRDVARFWRSSVRESSVGRSRSHPG